MITLICFPTEFLVLAESLAACITFSAQPTIASGGRSSRRSWVKRAILPISTPRQLPRRSMCAYGVARAYGTDLCHRQQRNVSHGSASSECAGIESGKESNLFWKLVTIQPAGIQPLFVCQNPDNIKLSLRSSFLIPRILLLFRNSCEDNSQNLWTKFSIRKSGGAAASSVLFNHRRVSKFEELASPENAYANLASPLVSVPALPDSSESIRVELLPEDVMRRSES